MNLEEVVNKTQSGRLKARGYKVRSFKITGCVGLRQRTVQELQIMGQGNQRSSSKQSKKMVKSPPRQRGRLGNSKNRDAQMAACLDMCPDCLSQFIM